MKLLLIATALLSTTNIGIAENEHYINYTDGTGYYIENDLGLQAGDVTLEVAGNIFVIDQLH